ncbi:maltose acetyltransferase [Flavobacterium branchiophilum]|uniref:Maltose O-acetyltransferase n=2 Tax=Flavobacterium branchiophilum TaxID=55197 RepID=G2Z5D0_FLABF|nr:sugar O-acetyltransferase [Flavobacterium branchiophilum]OXA75025.1 maltose acetyltransferase [Flavobacterium branchiophilum] [Flavobacterium branchiophilum NBRC 15030 = ATCC 35035]TQM41018.1 maltose O-acetyltransferase [Flavobacterium branchiophilum]GEM55982.1 maltose O-acetyltransferase [Flavobacterium branchiophilum NBRC 15030 = ATCC 35035]CCB68640.1 Maltose O-acetyltransferase [Flavobacterium branchiophilum FL-15]
MKTEKQKMLDGENYLANDTTLVNERLRAKKLLHRLNVTEYIMNGSARNILNSLLPNAHKKLYIEPPFHCDYGYNIHTGENVYFNVNCVVLDTMKVTIGHNVFFGPNVQIYTATHPLDPIERLTVEFSKPVTIGNDCWIGGNTTIVPGVTIGNGCTIGAGSVVTKNIPDGVLAAGNPAQIIRKL